MTRSRDTLTSRATTWVCAVGLVGVLCFLAGFSVLTQRSVAVHSRATDQATRLAAVYADARFWVSQEESLERKYRLEPDRGVLRLHDRAEANVERDLALVRRIDGSARTGRFLDSVVRAHGGYVKASHELFLAVDAHDPVRVNHYDHAIADPAFLAVQQTVYAASARASQAALTQSASLRHEETSGTRTIAVAFAFGLLLIAAFGSILLRLRRRLAAGRVRELVSLEAMAMSDPLTGVGNHRAFHEALPRALHRLARDDRSALLSLVLLDIDGLKMVNDTLGHQAGDAHILVVAEALRATMPTSAGIYRIGGDEFAILLIGENAEHAAELIERLHERLAAVARPIRVGVSAGIVETTEYRHRDALIREADVALLAAKRSEQMTIIYAPGLDIESLTGISRLQTGTLANALALAVDAKDSYTRSHCQTVSQLCALVAGELGLTNGRVARMRLAGLLHDVGKIGVADAILNKPGALDDDEYAQMQRHATLGGEIVAAANLAEESDWIRHHHERYDGTGYPDRLHAGEIPIESRIILVCDAYEAMTSNRPYRAAPGHAHAIDELRRNAGTQFDPDIVDALCRALENRTATSDADQREFTEAA